MRRLSKALVAVATGVALLVLSAAPSGASQTVTLTGGAITYSLIPPLTDPIGGTDPSCASTIDVHWDSTASWTNGHAAIIIKSPFPDSGNNYVTEISYSSTGVSSTHIASGTDASKWHINTAGFVATAVNIYPTTGVGSCTRSSTVPRCGDMDINFITGLDGTLTANGTLGDDHAVPVSSTVHLAGIGNIAAAGCFPPFSNMNGKTANIQSLTGHFTT